MFHRILVYTRYDTIGPFATTTTPKLVLVGAAIYYCTRLQPTVALSFTEVKFFISIVDGEKDTLYIRWMLYELGILLIKPTLIQSNNSWKNSHGQHTKTYWEKLSCENETIHHTTIDRR